MKDEEEGTIKSVAGEVANEIGCTIIVVVAIVATLLFAMAYLHIGFFQ